MASLEHKEFPYLLISTPGQRDLYVAPEEARSDEWLEVLSSFEVPRAKPPALQPLGFDVAAWPQLAAVFERSAAGCETNSHDESLSSPHGVRDAAGGGEAIISGRDKVTAVSVDASPVLSWPPEEGGSSPLLEATVRAVAGEVSALEAARLDEPSVRRAVDAAHRAEASVAEKESGGNLSAEAGRDVAAAVLSVQGVDWEARADDAMRKIDAQGTEFEEQLQHLRERGALPAGVRDVAVEQLLDAVGVIATTVHGLVQQAKTEGKRRGFLSSPTKDRLFPELRNLFSGLATLRRWGFDLPQLLLDAGERELLSMPLAATDPVAVDGARGRATVQRVIGALVVAGGAAGLKHVAWVNFDDKGEPVFEKAKYTGFKPIPEPTGKELDAPECASLATDLRVYGERATEATATLVPKVLDDVEAYADAKAEATSHPDAKAALDELDKLCKQAGKGGLERAMELVKQSDADAPPPTALEHAVHKQQRAVAGSKRLYQLVSDTVRGVKGHELVVLPGGVKKLARTVFKSAVNYRCDLSRITDQARCTVVASTLSGVAAALRGLMECGAVSVVRVKNRFASDFDATPAGGYLDLQTMVVFESGGGGWVMGEVQINLWSMMRIKESTTGGHKVFNFARALRAYDEAVFNHKGGFDDGVAARIAAGVMLRVTLEKGSCFHESKVAALCQALTSGECRVTKLDLSGNAIGDTGMAALTEALKKSMRVHELVLVDCGIGSAGVAALACAITEGAISVTKIDISKNAIDDKGAAALADALKGNSTITLIDLHANEIGNPGAVVLADALKSSAAKIGLSWDKLGASGRAALDSVPRSRERVRF